LVAVVWGGDGCGESKFANAERRQRYEGERCNLVCKDGLTQASAAVRPVVWGMEMASQCEGSRRTRLKRRHKVMCSRTGKAGCWDVLSCGRAQTSKQMRARERGVRESAL
jgi:hypothetical protein